MEGKVTLNIPIHWQQRPFFHGTKLTCRVGEEERIPFYHEICLENGLQYGFPWNDEESINKFFLQWNNAEKEISSCFKKRDRKNAGPLMVNQIGYFIEALFWGNGKPVRNLIALKQELANLEIKPVNLEERLEYLIDQPDLYISFVQLKELASEYKKKILKHYALQKTNKK
ncbi:YpoC family protein [Pseudalkalibacillus caeni]|uniref:YpoC-like domain-containing protein n=1 Tax=Exobacillus caeni TaxID=2574798 RepID=A0A5R9EXQ1_9BACL|nr:hypothetical protein [Pseudalkalibacillus caeni]TLS35877.1 hypothetical protein FCL54_17930 [Pseudalkalibacillus caeni]